MDSDQYVEYTTEQESELGYDIGKAILPDILTIRKMKQ